VSDSVVYIRARFRRAKHLQPAVRHKDAHKLKRGEHEWHFSKNLPVPDGWNLSSSLSPFDTMSIETGETATGKVYRAMLAECETPEPRLTLSPTGSDDCPQCRSEGRDNAAAFGLTEPLRTCRGLWRAAWLHSAGCSLQLVTRPV